MKKAASAQRWLQCACRRIQRMITSSISVTCFQIPSLRARVRAIGASCDPARRRDAGA